MKKNFFSRTITLALVLCCALPTITVAQESQPAVETGNTQPDSNRDFYLRPSYWRPYDQRGINVFETGKQADSIAFEGARVRLGAGFTQQYQNLKHENKGATNYQTTNKLYPLTPGFMTSQANLMLDIQLADGIRLNVTTYLSSRHHNEHG